MEPFNADFPVDWPVARPLGPKWLLWLVRPPLFFFLAIFWMVGEFLGNIKKVFATNAEAAAAAAAEAAPELEESAADAAAEQTPVDATLAVLGGVMLAVALMGIVASAGKPRAKDKPKLPPTKNGNGGSGHAPPEEGEEAKLVPPAEVNVKSTRGSDTFQVKARVYIRAKRDDVYALLTKPELKTWASAVRDVKEVDRDGSGVSINTQVALWRFLLFSGRIQMTMRNEEQVDARSVRQELVDSTRSLRHLEASWHVEDDPNRPGLCIAVLSQRVSPRLVWYPAPVRAVAAKVLRRSTLTVLHELKAAAEETRSPKSAEAARGRRR